MKPVRVLVVDDSATMRGLISRVLSKDPLLEVVGQAADPIEARGAIKALNPDVVTLDVEMPNMNGIDFLEKIMRLRPTPVIMVSNLTGNGATTTIKALEMGAFDCVVKPSSGEEEPFSELPAKVKAAAQTRPRPLGTALSIAATPAVSFRPNGKIVAIGSSTGGVEALLAILSDFPVNCPPTVITQHMPATFTKSFAERLNRITPPHVKEAADGDILAPGHIYLAPGGAAHLEIVGAEKPRCRLRVGEAVNGHRPSCDVLFESVAKVRGADAVGVILTGMGRDGAAGLQKMLQAGAVTLGQDEATSLVYGMPRVAFEIGAVRKQIALKKMSHEILNLTGTVEK